MDLIEKQTPTMCCLQETHFCLKYTHRLKSEEMGKNISCKWKTKESRGILYFIKQKIYFKAKTVTRDKKHRLIHSHSSVSVEGPQ